jgi:hypothetical protein
MNTSPAISIRPDLRFGTYNASATPAEIIASFHRGPGATIVFNAPRPNRVWGAMPASQISEMWPLLTEQMKSGPTYFAINSCGELHRSKKTTGFFAYRTEEKLSFLNAFFIDIDRHEEWPDVDLHRLKSEALRMSDFRCLPSPTWTVHSGRGVWLLWQFENPIASTPEIREQWRAAAESLAEIFKQLRIDRGSSIDITRIMRVPGSINPEAAGHRVEFSRIGPMVDFFTMTKAVGVVPQPTPITRAEHERKLKNPAKVRAARARWQKAYQGFEKLIQARNVIPEGLRSWAVFYMAQFMKRAGIDHRQIDRRCFYLGLSQCAPPLEVAVIQNKIASGKARPKRKKDGKLCYSSLGEVCERFSVTADELRQIPELVKKQRPQTKRQKTVAAIFRILSEYHVAPAPKELLRLLKESGHVVSLRSVYRYVDRLTDVAGCSKAIPRPTLHCAKSAGRPIRPLKTVLPAKLANLPFAKKTATKPGNMVRG